MGGGGGGGGCDKFVKCKERLWKEERKQNNNNKWKEKKRIKDKREGVGGGGGGLGERKKKTILNVRRRTYFHAQIWNNTLFIEMCSCTHPQSLQEMPSNIEHQDNSQI